MAKRIFVLMTAVATAALAALPASASAQNTLACQFSGVAGSITPGVMLVQGSGDYTFSTPAGSTGTRCSRNGGLPMNASIFSQGSFENIICGTGEAWSDPGGARDDGTHRTTITPVGITSMRYTITFVGAQGVIDITHVNGRPDQLPRNGRVTIVPAEGESCMPSPLDTTGPGVNAFNVVGEFAARW